MTRVVHPHISRSAGGMGGLLFGTPGSRGLGALGKSGQQSHRWVTTSDPNVFRHYGGDSYGSGEYRLNLVSDQMCRHSSGSGCSWGPAGEGLSLAGRKVKSVRYVSGANKWIGPSTNWRYDEGSQSIVVWGRGDGTWDVEYEPLNSAAEHDYRGAERNIQTMIDRISSCTLSRTTEVPSNWRLPPPPSDAPSSVQSQYDSYLFALNTELPNARSLASIDCQTGGGGSATTPASGGSATTSGSDPYASDPGGGSLIVPGLTPGEDPYGQGAYQPNVDIWREGGTVVTNPFAPPTPVATAAEPRGMSRGAKIGIGGVVVLGAVAYMVIRKKKRSRKTGLGGM